MMTSSLLTLLQQAFLRAFYSVLARKLMSDLNPER